MNLKIFVCSHKHEHDPNFKQQRNEAALSRTVPTVHSPSSNSSGCSQTAFHGVGPTDTMAHSGKTDEVQANTQKNK